MTVGADAFSASRTALLDVAVVSGPALIAYSTTGTPASWARKTSRR